MRQGILPLNSFISVLYVFVSAITLAILKKAVKPRLCLSKASKKQLQTSTKSVMNYDKLLFLAWLKKYTLIGSFFVKDKKFLLKESAFVSAYAVTCLNVNHLIIWPLGLSAVILITSFLLLQLMVFKYQQRQIGETATNKVKTIHTQAQSQIEIQSANIQNLKRQVKTQEQVKLDAKKQRSLVQLVAIASLGFASLVMLLQTALTLANSVSNSGQLNILSVLSILAIDQLALRPLTGGFIWIVYKVVTNVTEIKPEQFQLVQYLSSQELTSILIENEKVRLKKLAEMTASPPKRKSQSPSRVPKGLRLSADAPTYLNLLSFQPTKREKEAQDEQIQNIYLTTAQKELFEGKETLQNKSGMQTRRKGNKENSEIYSLSAAQKGTTIDASQNQDLVLIKDHPLHQIDNNHTDDFYLEQHDGTTRRKNGYKKKKNRRNLKLTGNSPYLEYLPDMLKKVDKYKNEHPKKDNDQNKKSKKVL